MKQPRSKYKAFQPTVIPNSQTNLELVALIEGTSYTKIDSVCLHLPFHEIYETTQEISSKQVTLREYNSRNSKDSLLNKNTKLP